MTFPILSDSLRLERLQPPSGKVRMVLDTDTYNEIDDQFALVHALLSPEQMTVEAIYAAPFYNARSDSPADGMHRSYDEIVRLLDRMNMSADGLAYRGSEGILPNLESPYRSAAALDLVERALNNPADDPLYVVAIGALTNVASALLIEPKIIEHIVVVWLGGHALHWPHTQEFNLQGDVTAARLVLDCGVPLVLIPCAGVTTHLRSTVAEIEQYVQGQGAIGDYLAETYKGYHQDHYAWSKEIWDVVAIAYLINAAWIPSNIVASPMITERPQVTKAERKPRLTWSFDNSRHLIRCAYYLERDPIFRDLFMKLEKWAAQNP